MHVASIAIKKLPSNTANNDLNAASKLQIYKSIIRLTDLLCGLVVRVSGYSYRGPGFDSRRYQIF